MAASVRRKPRPGRARVQTGSLPLFAAARRKQSVAADLAELGERPPHLSTGLPSVDRALRGGFPVGGLTLVAARRQGGASSLLVGASLNALARGQRVAYFSERTEEAKLKGRLVVQESRVNGYRIHAGFISAEDRLALVAARERIPWHALTVRCQKRIPTDTVDTDLFAYRPWLTVADIRPRAPEASGRSDRLDAVSEGLQRLRLLAQRHRVAMVVRMILPQGGHPPDRAELPGVGAVAALADAVMFVHRDLDGSAGRAEAMIIRVADADVEPRIIPLRFDQRFAGLLEPSPQA